MLFKKNPSSTSAEKEYRVRPLRSAIICILIAAVCISMSVGLGYSKFKTASAPLTVPVKTYDLTNASANTVVVPRNDNGKTVLNYQNGKIKVTIPKTAEGENLGDDVLAFGLVVSTNSSGITTDYTRASGQNRLSYSLSLLSLPRLATDQNNARYTVDTTKSIELEIKIGTGAVSITSGLSDAPYNLTTSYNATTGVLKFTGIGQLKPTVYTIDARWNEESWANDVADPDVIDADTYSVSTAAQLAGLAQLVNAGNDFAGKTIMLDSDIDLGNRPWIPIGTSDHPFSGTFDGQLYTIKNLNVPNYDYSDVSGDVTAGLFGYVDGDGTNEIRNLWLRNVHIAADLTDNGTYSAVGGIAGEALNVTLKNIRVVNINISAYAEAGGGVIGYGDGSTVMQNCQAASLTNGGDIDDDYFNLLVGEDDGVDIDAESGEAPTEAPTAAPTAAPTSAPTAAPTNTSTESATDAPTEGPTDAPATEPEG